MIRCPQLSQLTPAVTRQPLYAQLRAQNPEVKLRGKHMSANYTIISLA
jgi:hypothetical protein